MAWWVDLLIRAVAAVFVFLLVQWAIPALYIDWPDILTKLLALVLALLVLTSGYYTGRYRRL